MHWLEKGVAYIIFEAKGNSLEKLSESAARLLSLYSFRCIVIILITVTFVVSDYTYATQDLIDGTDGKDMRYIYSYPKKLSCTEVASSGFYGSK